MPIGSICGFVEWGWSLDVDFRNAHLGAQQDGVGSLRHHKYRRYISCRPHDWSQSLLVLSASW